MLKWHPDLHQGDTAREQAAHERAVAINHAFEHVSGLLQRRDRIVVSMETAAASPRTRSADYRASRRETQPSAGFPDSSIIEVHVRSSNIHSIGYDRARRILYIKFLGGRLYRYFEVPEALFREFLAADSKGRFANRFVYSRFRYEPC